MPTCDDPKLKHQSKDSYLKVFKELKKLLVKSQRCGGMLKLKTQGVTFKSPLYPRNYPKRIKCRWKTKTKSPLIIHCIFFDVEYDRKCYKDYLMIADGKKKKRFCGKKGPKYFLTTRKNPKLIFRSNNNGLVKKGFVCKIWRKKGFSQV
ncbi:CUB domain-containing protein 2-like [Oratosquilla oratoria]|uniref:CUB domain-containing protein 2-like n=1 Tax=Oratosquilla oratoria TaxID=337810 RepID=UPI003F7730A2